MKEVGARGVMVVGLEDRAIELQDYVFEESMCDGAGRAKYRAQVKRPIS